MQHAVKSSPMDDVEEYFWGKNCSPCAGVTSQGESLWVHSNDVNGKPTFHRHANLSWLSKICNYFGEIAAGSRKSLTLIKPKWRFFGKKTPYGNFSQMFSKPPHSARKHVFLCKFREIWPIGSRWNRALFNGQKKFGSPSRCRFCADRAQNLSGTAPNNRSEFPKFHPNQFNSGGVIAELVNIVQTRHKVFAILGEAWASSPSKEIYRWHLKA